MSLALLQSYSSAEEEEEEPQPRNVHLRYNTDDDDDDDEDDDHRLHEASTSLNRPISDRSLFDQPLPSSNATGLPSAFDAFSEVSGPPEFLNNCVEEYAFTRDVDQQHGRHGRRRNRKDKKDLPTGAVVEAKAQLVGIHERVRSDIEGSQPPTTAVASTAQGVKRVATAANPSKEDAAELLRMCLQCGVPKTYTSAQGMVCPMCGDRPPADPNNESKKKGSTVKDKEKSKRMKGQSSHATWKSETEMHLRQQFD